MPLCRSLCDGFQLQGGLSPAQGNCLRFKGGLLSSRHNCIASGDRPGAGGADGGDDRGDEVTSGGAGGRGGAA